MDKEPGHRYQSGEELVLDLERFLEGEAVEAPSSTTWKRGVEWAKHRPATVGFLWLGSLAIASLLLGMLWYGSQGKLADVVEGANSSIKIFPTG